MRHAERRNGAGCPAGARQHAHVAVTGEPGAGTTGTAGSDRGSLEKGMPNRYLASDLPVRCARRRAAGSVPVVHDVEDVAVRSPHEEPAHTPWLCGERVHDLVAES